MNAKSGATRQSGTRRRYRRFVAAGTVLFVVVLLLSAYILVQSWLPVPDTSGGFLWPELGTSTGAALAVFISALLRLCESTGRRHFCGKFRMPVALGLVALALAGGLARFAIPGDNLEQLLFIPGGLPVRWGMSPATALCVLFAAACLGLTAFKRRSAQRMIYSASALAGLSVCVFALTGHAFDSAALRATFAFSAMALSTAAAFFLLFSAFLLTRPSWGWPRIVVGGGPGSASLRRTLPPAVASPFVFSWIALLAVDAGLLDVNIRLSILALASAITIVALLVWFAARTNAAAAETELSHARLRKALRNRDVLLKEVYHRVKNNLQLVDAMLGLEAVGADSGTVQRLESVRGRVYAMSLVHQQLLASDDLATIDLGALLRELCTNQAKSAALDARRISVDFQVPSILVSLEQAVPIALTVTELLANSAKHAFPGGRGGHIVMAAELVAGSAVILTVADDGVGEDAAQGAAGMGSLIIRSLGSQLGATMEVTRRNGYATRLTIPLTSAD